MSHMASPWSRTLPRWSSCAERETGTAPWSEWCCGHKHHRCVTTAGHSDVRRRCRRRLGLWESGASYLLVRSRITFQSRGKMLSFIRFLKTHKIFSRNSWRWRWRGGEDECDKVGHYLNTSISTCWTLWHHQQSQVSSELLYQTIVRWWD